MRYLYQTCIVFLLIFISSSVLYANVSCDTVTFIEHDVTTIGFQTPDIQLRHGFLSSKKGGGVILGDIVFPTSKPEEWREMVNKSFQTAKNTWEAYLQKGDTVIMNISFSAGQTDDAITSVYCSSIIDTIAYPRSLFRKLYGLLEDDSFEYDAEVSLNENANWCLGVGENCVGKNLTLTFMRCIAAAMGFGTSFTTASHNRIVRQSAAYVVFDHYVFNTANTKLSDFTISKTLGIMSDLRAFLQSQTGDLYFRSPNSSYKLYAPNPFDAAKSLRFFDAGHSLMSYPISDSLDVKIDDATLNVLNTIGWHMTDTEDELEILGEDIDSTGVASAYSSHRFYLAPNSLSLYNKSWKCFLRLADGSMQEYASATGDELTVPAIADENLYEHTVDGEIIGEIVFSGMSDGEKYEACYQLRFQLKPSITFVSEIEFTPCATGKAARV